MPNLSTQSDSKTLRFTAKSHPKNMTKRPIYTGYLSGVKFYDFREICTLLRTGDSLIFIREPDNRYDEFATAVWYKNWKLGYIPKSENIVLANMLDLKMPLAIYVSRVDGCREMFGSGLEVEVSMV